MCGGLAFTGWQVLGADDPATRTAAGRPSDRPTAAGSGAAPAPVTPVPTSAAPTSAVPTSAVPSGIPAGSTPQPIGISHVVTWPDDATIRWGGKVAGEYAFAVPPQGLTKLEIELIPRPGDAPARWAGSVD